MYNVYLGFIGKSVVDLIKLFSNVPDFIKVV